MYKLKVGKPPVDTSSNLCKFKKLCGKKTLAVIILLSIVVYSYTVVLLQNDLHCDHSVYMYKSNRTDQIKRVLLWTPTFGAKDWNMPKGQDVFRECSEKRCEVITDKCLQPGSEAVMFHLPDLQMARPPFPKTHPPGQIWIIMSMESEVNYPGRTTDWDDKFNWTQTFRHDSDIYLPYYAIFKIIRNESRLQQLPPKSVTKVNLIHKAETLVQSYHIENSTKLFSKPDTINANPAKSKTKMALWFVSNCDSDGTRRRIEIYQELKNHIDIDVFGDPYECGEIKKIQESCHHKKNCNDQEIEISSYKFYLSFENCECDYYITEKFFKPLSMGTVPIAFGAPLKHYEAVAPKDSFLHLSNFSSIEDLAKYMKFLDANDEIYNRYLKWKEDHIFSHSNNNMCRICADLWDKKKKPKSYPRFSQWWNKQKHCKTKDHLFSWKTKIIKKLHLARWLL